MPRPEYLPTVRAFNQMSTARKRVVIAEDVIAALEAKRFSAGGGYAASYDISDAYYNKHGGNVPSGFYDREVRDLLTELKLTCNLCQLGGMYLAVVDRNNACTLDSYSEVEDRCEMTQRLETYFDADQLDMMETAFERGVFGCMRARQADKITPSLLFGQDHRDPEDRMIAICQNIIDHKGEFVPEDRYDVATKTVYV